VTAALLIAKLSLLGVLFTFLPLFAGVRVGRRPLAIGLVAAVAALAASAAVALRHTSLSVAGLPGARTGALAAVASGSLLQRWPLLVGAAVGGLAVLAGLTWLAWRFPKWALPAALVLMPIRVPIGSVHLLAPFYLVVLAVLIAEVVLRDRLAPPAGAGRDHMRLALAAFVAMAGLSATWAGLDVVSATSGFAAALVKLFAFYLPFAVVYYLVFRYARTVADFRRLLLTIIWLGVGLAVIGIIQYSTRFVFFNRATILHQKALGQGFRVNSLFSDPNMFSRFLIMALLICAALALIERLWRRRLAGVAVLAAVANVFTLSRSGWVALAAGLVLLAYAWLGARKGTLVLAGLVVLTGAGLGVLFLVRGTPIRSATLAHPWGINKITGGRYYLIQGGLLMFRAHPQGVGVGDFPLVYPTYRDRHARAALTESHTTPVTVLAELGGAGLGLYFIVIFTAFSTALGRGPRTLRPPAAAHAPPEEELPDHRLFLVKAGLAAVVLAILVHSLLYNAFFEDPYLWTMLALIAAAACRLTVWEVRSATISPSRNA
jgi:putative inorganic carbon (hco3(-)) transporter